MNQPSPTALIIAHPGHELCLHGWLVRHRPTVSVLTDGSGGAGRPRLDATSRLLEQAGATRGPIYGRFSDREIYDRLLSGEFRFFLELTEEIRRHLLELGAETVVADAAENYNSSHDLCRAMVDAAATAAGYEKPLECYEFPLAGHPTGLGRPDEALELTPDTFAAKMAAVEAYQAITGEAETLFRQYGAEAFRTECLSRVQKPFFEKEPPTEKPFYEVFGEKRVAEGRYRHVIRYGEHVAPLLKALRDYTHDFAR